MSRLSGWYADWQERDRRATEATSAFFRRLLFRLWRMRLGWALVLLVGVALAAIPVALITLSPSRLAPAIGDIAIYFLFGAWLCIGILLFMIRRHMRRRARQWNEMAMTGKTGRMLVTVLGTALLLTPFVLVGWRVLR